MLHPPTLCTQLQLDPDACRRKQRDKGWLRVRALILAAASGPAASRPKSTSVPAVNMPTLCLVHVLLFPCSACPMPNLHESSKYKLHVAKYMLSAVEHQKDVTNRNPAKEPRSARSILHRYSASSIAKARDPTKWQGLRPRECISQWS